MTTYERCGVTLIHAAEQNNSQCVLGSIHTLDDTDHVDEHGCRAHVLVHQSTIREVAAVSRQRQRDEEQEVFDREHSWAGAMQSFDVAPNGDVAVVVSVPSEGIQEVIVLKASELAGLAEASKNKREDFGWQ